MSKKMEEEARWDEEKQGKNMRRRDGGREGKREHSEKPNPTQSSMQLCPKPSPKVIIFFLKYSVYLS